MLNAKAWEELILAFEIKDVPMATYPEEEFISEVLVRQEVESDLRSPDFLSTLDSQMTSRMPDYQQGSAVLESVVSVVEEPTDSGAMLGGSNGPLISDSNNNADASAGTASDDSASAQQATSSEQAGIALHVLVGSLVFCFLVSTGVLCFIMMGAKSRQVKTAKSQKNKDFYSPYLDVDVESNLDSTTKSIDLVEARKNATKLHGMRKSNALTYPPIEEA